MIGYKTQKLKRSDKITFGDIFCDIYRKVNDKKYNPDNNLTFNDEIEANEEYKKWMKNYKLANSYYVHHGNLEIPKNFKTTNGYEYDEEGVELGIWISIQRQSYKGQGKNKLTEEQMEILNRLNSYLNTLDENRVYSKEELNSGFVKKLSK